MNMEFCMEYILYYLFIYNTNIIHLFIYSEYHIYFEYIFTYILYIGDGIRIWNSIHSIFLYGIERVERN